MDETEKQGWTLYLLIICIDVTFGTVIPIGYCFGVVNAPAEYIKKWAAVSAKSRYSLTLTDSQLTLIIASVVSMFQIGGIIGSLLATSFNSKCGRRGTLIISNMILVISGLLQLLCRWANSIELLLMGRLVGGVAAAIIYSTQPMYLVELAPQELSGSVGVFTCIGITGGIVLGQLFSFDFILGNERYWHFALAGYIVFVVIGLGELYIFPESPRYLMSKGRIEKTKAVLLRLRGNPARVERELLEFRQEQLQEKASMAAVICNSKLTMPLILVMSFHFCQQASGISVIWYYSVDIFTGAGFSLTVALWLNFAEGVWNFVVALFGPLLMKSCNRRLMMLLSCLFSAIFLTLLSVGLKIMETHKLASTFCIIFLSMYILSFNCALGSIPYFIGSEIFDTAPRAAAMALGSLCNWITNCILSMIFPIMQTAIGAYSFLPCAVACIYGFLLTYRYLPETRNRPTKDVTPLLEHGFKSKVK